MGTLIKNTIVNPRNKRIEFNRFYGVDRRIDGDVGNYSKAEESYNFSLLDGTLKTCDGAIDVSGEYRFSGVPVAIYFYKRNDYENGKFDDRIIIYALDGLLYECSHRGGEFTVINGLSFINQPIGVCYNYNSKDVIIFSGDRKLFVYDGESVEEISDAPPVTSMCIQNERLFLTSDGTDGALWFSDDFDPTNWSVSLNEAGFIDINDERGEMLCAVNFAGYVFIFLSYGISRLTAFSDQTEFYLTHLLTSCGKIVKNSITVCGDCITFIASDGIYRFDGYSVTKISEPIDAVLDLSNKEIKGTYYNGYVYYILNAYIGGESKKCILKIMPNGKDYSFIVGGNITDILTVKSYDDYSLLCVESNSNKICKIIPIGSIANLPTKKIWKSKESDFGIKTAKKVLEKISFFTSANVKFTLFSDGKVNEYNVLGGKWTTLRPRIKANKFAFEIKCEEEEVEVSGLTLDFVYYL